jgi:hypothetical protein
LNELDDRLAAIRFLEALVPEGGVVFELAEPYRNVQSLGHLFRLLVQDHKFAIAEKLWRSDVQAKLNEEVLVRAILEVSADVDPKCYMGLLQNVVFPTLSIGHESHEFGLNESILLLQVRY